ncbi:putative ABC transporter permease [Diplocloster hominis]|uniref:putative ABC transporter permease n=1 Tax=Diplocloster hominis TaxID=3079010 RepID=UPI0031BA178C
MKHKFIICGTIGWCMEIFWTAFNSFRRRELKLMGRTSIWMFPIYGSAALLAPIYRLIRSKSIWLRGIIYTVCIYLTEFFTGSFLKKYNLCPWDYSKAKLNYKGLVRLDYLPLWFLTGLLYEKVLCKDVKS